MTDMADANGLQRAITHTGFFNIKKMAAEFCSARCIMDNTRSLIIRTISTISTQCFLDLHLKKYGMHVKFHVIYSTLF